MTAGPGARARADQIGADACLAKPFDLDRLLAVVAACRAAAFARRRRRLPHATWQADPASAGPSLMVQWYHPRGGRTSLAHRPAFGAPAPPSGGGAR